MNTSAPLMIFHLDLNYTSLNPAYLRRLLSQVAAMGYNAVLWELENKVRWTTCPECVWPEAMTKAEFRDLLAFSRELGLEPIPLLQTVGHGEYVMKDGPYFRFREQADRSDCYCVSHPGVREFLRDWIKEYLELFGELRYFHLGGDEAYVFGTCPECRKRIAASSANRLYAEHVTAVAEPLLAAGVRPGVWCDMLLHHPEEINCLPPEFVIWDWNYWDGWDTPQQTLIWHLQHNVSAEQAKQADLTAVLPELCDNDGHLRPFHTVDTLFKAGREVILCSSSRCAGDSYFVPQLSLHAANIAGAAAKTRDAQLLGNCVTSWAIRLNNYATQEKLLALAPAVMRSTATPQEAIEQLLPTEFRRAADAVAVFPALWSRFSAIQWNTLKDSLPAPHDHISGIIANLEAKSDPAWRDRCDNIDRAIKGISAGLSAMIKSFPNEPAWHGGGMLQLRFFQALKKLFGQNRSLPNAAEELRSLKADFEEWIRVEHSPLSARQNAGLIFDPLLEYAEKNKI